MNAAVKAAKEQSKENEPVTLSTGVRVRLVPTPSMLIEAAQAEIKDPPVPTQEVDGRIVENPVHPDYLEAKQKAFRDRAQAGIDAMMLFGVELIDGLPEDDLWIQKLRFMEKRNQIDLSEFDLDNELECEFVYKKFIAVGNEDWQLLARMNGISQGDVDRARESFRSSESGNTNSSSGAKKSGQES